VRQDLVERARRGDREAFGDLAAGEIDHLLVRWVMRLDGAVGQPSASPPDG
jgi:hypothetical protein